MAENLDKDKYGRTVTVLTEVDKDHYDIYGADGAHHFRVTFKAGWPRERAYYTIESMISETAATTPGKG